MGWAHPGLTMRGTMIGCATTVNLLPFGAFGAWEPASWAVAFTCTLRCVLSACQKHYDVVCPEMQNAPKYEWSSCNKLRRQPNDARSQAGLSNVKLHADLLVFFLLSTSEVTCF